MKRTFINLLCTASLLSVLPFAGCMQTNGANEEKTGRSTQFTQEQTEEPTQDDQCPDERCPNDHCPDERCPDGNAPDGRCPDGSDEFPHSGNRRAPRDVIAPRGRLPHRGKRPEAPRLPVRPPEDDDTVLPVPPEEGTPQS